MENRVLDVKIYNELVKSMQLQNINLIKADVEKFGEINGNMSVEMGFSIEGYERKDNELHIKPQLKLTILNDGENDIISEIECTYFIMYTSSLIDTTEDMYLETFIGKTIQHTVWPYFRELVASLMSRMGYSSFVLPIFIRE